MMIFYTLNKLRMSFSSLCMYSCIFSLISCVSLSDSSPAFPLHTCSVLFYDWGFLSVRAVSPVLSIACYERVIILTLPNRSYVCCLNKWLMVLPPPLSFSTTVTAKPTKAGRQSRPAGTFVVERLRLPAPCVNASEGVHGGVRMGEVPTGALVQAEPALQVNGTAGSPARQLLSTYSVLAQSELRSGHLHSDFFFPFIKTGSFFAITFSSCLLFWPASPCLHLNLAITFHSAF